MSPRVTSRIAAFLSRSGVLSKPGPLAKSPIGCYFSSTCWKSSSKSEDGMKKIESMSRREREMMDIIFRAGKATAGEVMDAMANPPSYSAVRATLRVLENKGLLRHEDDGTRYVYRPTLNREKARQNALDHLMATFFDGSVAKVVAALLEKSSGDLSPQDLDRIAGLIASARKEGR
jgi:predicted transcriptional regulator